MCHFFPKPSFSTKTNILHGNSHSEECSQEPFIENQKNVDQKQSGSFAKKIGKQRFEKSITVRKNFEQQNA
jgi:hypothetical protein